MASRRRGWLWMLVGLLFALIAAFVAMAVVELKVQQTVTEAEPARQAATPEPMAAVVVAVVHIPPTRLIVESDLSLQEFPADIVPDGAASDIEAVVGKIAMGDMYPGEVVLSMRLADPDITGENVAFTMPRDRVLLAVAPNDLMSNIRILKPGDLVDVLFSLKPEKEATPQAGQDEEDVIGEGMFTTAALQNQRITAIVMSVSAPAAGNQAQAPVGGAQAPAVVATPSRPEAILLALEPQDALIVKYFRDAGGVMDIVLRHPANEALHENLQTVNLSYIKDLYGLPGEALGR